MATKKADTAKMQKACDEFNAKCKVGGMVTVKLDDGTTLNTVTVSEAQIMGGHTAVIWLLGVSGCYALERVTPIEAGNGE